MIVMWVSLKVQKIDYQLHGENELIITIIALQVTITMIWYEFSQLNSKASMWRCGRF